MILFTNKYFLHKKLGTYSILFFISLLFTSSVFGQFTRRKPQFSKESGYFIVPAPYNLPGLGKGIAFVGYLGNIADTYSDLYALSLTGDVVGNSIGVTDVHLLEKTLVVDFAIQTLNKASFRSYQERGMSSSKEEFSNIQIAQSGFQYFRSTLTFSERRVEIILSLWKNTYQLDSITDSDGNTITELVDSEKQTTRGRTGTLKLDFTDDYLDPRKGLRIEAVFSKSPRQTSTAPDFYIREVNTTLYIPVGRINTLVFNYFRSDAVVESKGDTDATSIATDYGFACELLTDTTTKQECESAKTSIVNNAIAHNTYGTATSLGGQSRLRSFPQARFIGAHTEFYGAEFRWNLTEEFTPFNYGFLKDTRTGVQLAFFVEQGSVADQKEDLSKNRKMSYGVGARVVLGSGLVYRLDYASGDEGAQPTLIVNYPWGDF
ncbi:MAG: hypothetical protein ACI86H_003036 [bacterium]|jgi:hypothetical protein